MRDQAKSLEIRAELSRIAALAETPRDGIALVVDLTVATAHQKAAKHARANGHEPPPAPPPISKFLTNFTAALRDKVLAVHDQLADADRARLAALAPRLQASVTANDHDVIQTLVGLMEYPPNLIALWIRVHIDQIEARFAS